MNEPHRTTPFHLEHFDMRIADELRAADERNASAIAALEARMDGTEQRLTRTEQATERMSEAITVLREAVAKVATKDDILKLSQNIDDKFNTQLRDAHNSIPTKIGLLIAAAALIAPIVSLFLSRHG